ncbi:MAG TPA: MFS transporter, partial [Methylococcales bacterium]
MDVGIIAGALPYLESTSGLNANQLSVIVAAVLLGSVLATLFAGVLADCLGRKLLMVCSGILFVISIPAIALSHGYGPLVFGRLLQGISAGLIGVVIPLYLAECLSASNRGRGTGVFQLLLTMGIVAAAVIGYYFSIQVEHVQKLNDPSKLFAFKDMAWRWIFWVSLPPGFLFVIGSLIVAESPRWLFRHGKKEAAKIALLRSRTPEQANVEIQEMEETVAGERAHISQTGKHQKDFLLSRKYVIPFVLACVILVCNQTTGIASIIGYNANILIQAGLNDKQAHLGYVILTVVNFCMTIGAIALVDKKGRKFLLALGSAGVIFSLLSVAILFYNTEKNRVDCKDAVQAMVNSSGQKLAINFTGQMASMLLAASGECGVKISGIPVTMTIIYSYGDYSVATKVVRSDDVTQLDITRENCVPSNKIVAFFSNPFADFEAAHTAPLEIEHA